MAETWTLRITDPIDATIHTLNEMARIDAEIIGLSVVRTATDALMHLEVSLARSAVTDLQDRLEKPLTVLEANRIAVAKAA